VNFDFSEEQRLLQSEVGRMLSEVSTPAEVRRILEGEETYSVATWRQLVDMGAAQCAIPEEYGGSGLGYLDLCLVAEEAGRNLAAVPLVSSIYLTAETVLRGGTSGQKAHWLRRLASGEAIGTAAFAHFQRIRDIAPPVLDGDCLSGAVTTVPDGGIADVAIVQAGDVLLLLDLRIEGVTRKMQASIDPTRPLAEFHFDRVPAQRLADSSVTRRVLDTAAILIAFEQLGGAERMLAMTRDYALQRRAFGRPIGGFQAVKHKLADIYTAIEIARVHAYYGAWALSTGASELPRAAAAARLSATRAYELAASEGLHLHGGIGFTWEMDCHLHLRRSRWLGQIIGSTPLWQSRLADLLIDEEA
jgi:acyl-CoA dehydrogenase